MALVYSKVPCVAAGTFTSNVVKAAPVLWDRSIVRESLEKVQAVVVNSGVANACTIPVLMGQSVQRIPLEKRSTAMGFYQAMYSLGMTFGPMAMGVLIDRFGYVPSFDAMACLGLLTCVLTWSLLRRPRGTQLPA